MPNDILTAALQRLVRREDLDADQARAVLAEMMDGRAGDAQTAAVLTALRVKGETAAELVGFARAMTERAERVEFDADVILDTCGTGGDGAGTFNISTAAAFVAAVAGVPVAKHGNRSATSSCGSADVLEELGVHIELGPAQVAACLRECGIGFMFAPLHHRAMAHVAPVRRDLGIRTIFNIVGPLTNPAGARHQIIGVSDAAYVPRVAQAVRILGSARNLIVHSSDGLDEIGLGGPTEIVEVFADRGFDRRLVIAPEDVGLETAPVGALRGGDAAHNAALVRSVLNGEPGPRLDVVLLNAGAALYVAEAAPDIPSGVATARAAVASGAARAALDALIATSRRLAAESGATS
jgi:anthranilate phosphoribosyltransferase